MRDTTYDARLVETHLTCLDETCDTYCADDRCTGLEVSERDEGGTPLAVIRIGFDCGYVGPLGPTYSSGGEPGYASRDYCPECGSQEIEAL
jgi:hypothetical protein